MKRHLQVKLVISFFIAVHSFAQTSRTLENKFLTQKKQAVSSVNNNCIERSSSNSVLRSPANLLQIYDSVYFWTLDTSNFSWVIDNKWVDITYDAKNNLTGAINKTSDTSDWVNSGRFTDTYDADNNNTNYTEYYWDGATWMYTLQTNYTYDSKHNQLSTTDQEWNGSAWENKSQYLYSYDANNSMVSETYQKPQGTGWKNSSKNSYTYDSNNNLTTDLSQSWDSASSSWNDVAKRFYTYDSNNKIATIVSQYWNGTNWVNTYQITNTYANGNLVQELFQHYQGSSWVNSSQMLHNYGANNNLVTDLHQSWNGTTWINREEDNYAYGSDNFQKSIVSEYYDQSGDTIASGDSVFFYYHTVTTGISSLSTANSKLKIYPNPSSGKFIVELEHGFIQEVEIVNLTGQKILQQKSGVIDLSAYPEGVYFVRVISNEKMFTEKMVKN